MSSIAPTIGRKVWFFQSGIFAGVLDPKQAFDASIVFVHPDGKVNLLATDHNGHPREFYNVDLRDPGDADEHGHSDYATWMPYQVGQASASAAKKEPSADAAPGAAADPQA